MSLVEVTVEQALRLAALGWQWDETGFRHASGAWVRLRDEGDWLSCGAPGSRVYADRCDNPFVALARTQAIEVSEVPGTDCYTALTGREYTAWYHRATGSDVISERHRSIEDAALAAMERA